MNINNKGFTLIEMLVSMMIIGLLSTMILVNFSSYKKSSSLTMTTQQVMSEIRKVQNYSLAAKSDSFGKIPKGGWGVYLNSSVNMEVECDNKVCNKYLFIFADEDGNGLIDFSSEDYEKIEIPKGIIVKDFIFPKNGAGNVDLEISCDYLSLMFKSASSTVSIVENCPSPAAPEKGYGGIILTDEDGIKEKIIKFNVFGLLDVE